MTSPPSPRSTAAGAARLLLLAGLAWISGPVIAEQPSHAHASEPRGGPLLSPMTIPLDAAHRATLPRARAKVEVHGSALECEGVALQALLKQAGLLQQPLRGPQLTRYLLASGRDGYRAVYSLAELDPSLAGTRADALVVDQCNGTPLPEQDGPLRLLFPADARPARWVRQLESLVVVTAP